MGHFKRLLRALFTLVFVFELCGCSAFGAPATTEELLVRYVANQNVDNYSAKANLGLSVNALGVRAAVPTTVNLRMANNTAHGTIEIDLSSLDTRNYTMEFYAELLDDALNCYIGTPHGDTTVWKNWKVGMTAKIDIFTITELLAASELTVIAKDSDPQVRYELTVPTSKALETVFELATDPVEAAGTDERGLIDAVGNDKIRVGFTEDCLMRSLTTEALITFKSAETNNVVVRTDIEVSATIDEYGKTDPAQVAIPDDVREGATPTDEPIDVIEVIGADSPLAGAVGSQ